MDSRGESLQPPQHHHYHHHHQASPHSQSLMMAPPPLQQHQQQQQPPPNTYNNHNNNSINPNSIGASMMHQQQQHSHHQHQQQHHQQQQQHQQTQNPSRFPFSSENTQYTAEGSSPSSGGFRPGGGFSIEPARKKRGRPRKYSPSPDGNSIALGLAPAPITPISTVASGNLDSSNDGGGGGSSSNHNNNNNSQMSSDPSSGKKARGRPAGSGKKQLDALGSAGIGFTPHVIMVKTGEDIATKIMAFSQQGPRTVCILSANGAICNVTLRQSSMSGGTVTYEGRFEIISLSGSFLLSESNGNRSRNGGLSVSLAGPDGRVLGGGVAGMLVAATPVQVVVGSFIADGKKTKSGSSSAPPPNMLNFGAPVPGISPPSGGASSESSDESGSSPANRLSAPSYNNATQPIQNIPMYTTNLGWSNSTMNMLPN